MATDTRQIPIHSTTDADFRVWVAAIIAQLIAVGLTQTADTGQIDTATVTKAGASNTAQGYAIFRFNDTMQATRPLFLKFEFGSGSNTTNPGIWLTISDSTNGAGTMTGTVIKSRAQLAAAAYTLGAMDNHANYNASLGMLWANWSAYPGTAYYFTLLVARTCDDTETPDDRGVLHAWSGGIATPSLYTYAVGTNETMNLFTLPYVPSTSDPAHVTNDGYQVVYACQGYFAETGGFVTFPGILGIHASHWPTFWDIYATVFETERLYKCMPQNGTCYGWDSASTTSGKLAWLWE